MSQTHLTCRCGSVEISVDRDPATLHRYICHCDDCQAFARHLAAEEVYLDVWGGTEVVHATPKDIKIRKGSEHLRCLHLKAPKAMRWFAGCCQTPLLNTPPAQHFPFVSILARNLKERDALRPVEGRVQLDFGYGDLEPLKREELSKGKLIGRIIASMLGELVLFRHKRTPFFNSDGKPVAQPYRLTKDEQRTAYQRGVSHLHGNEG